jgi:hypothetical protein
MGFYEDSRRCTGPRLWWLRMRHVVLDRIDRWCHRLVPHYNRADDYEPWRFCDYVDELHFERLFHDRGYEDRLVRIGRLVPCVTVGSREDRDALT